VLSSYVRALAGPQAREAKSKPSLVGNARDFTGPYQ